jgi:hypothetical protein
MEWGGCPREERACSGLYRGRRRSEEKAMAPGPPNCRLERSPCRPRAPGLAMEPEEGNIPGRLVEGGWVGVVVGRMGVGAEA